MNPNLLGLNVYEHYIEARLTAGRGANTCVFAQLRVPARLKSTFFHAREARKDVRYRGGVGASERCYGCAGNLLDYSSSP